jgi:mono/diheme cytochrome c family protein
MICLSGAALAEQKRIGLAAPDGLVETGLLKFILPRFALKHGVRVQFEAPFGVEIARDGTTPIFEDGQGIWYLSVSQETETSEKFVAWITSDVGKRTIHSFTGANGETFNADIQVAAQVEERVFDGDAALGHRIALAQCGRCHVIDESNRMKAIGSTPSFAVLRGLPEWELRFTGFYDLKPHPAFTQIADVTDPFDKTRPSPIAPIELTLDDLENIVAFVSAIEPADLGAPIQYQ